MNVYDFDGTIFYSDSLADTPPALCAEKAHLVTNKAATVTDGPDLDAETVKKVKEKIDTGWNIHLKEAGIDFYVGASGEALTKEDLDWLSENGMGVIVRDTEYYRASDHPAVWGIDLKDEPNAEEFEGLAEQVKTLCAEAPDRFPMINLFPIYASDQQLGRTARGPLAFNESKIDALNKRIIRYRMHVSDYIGVIDSDIISFTNMYEPQTGKEASFTATFPGAETITIYRDGEKTEIAGETLELTLASRGGAFVTVE